VIIYVMCATARGARFVKCLFDLCPDDEFVVFSFRETPHEPPYLDQIAALAQERGATFIETRKVADPAHEGVWKTKPPDLLFLVSWRYLIPMSHGSRPRLGAVVFHDSLLPAYRGFSPTVWAILNGESQTGATMFHLAEEVDSGDIIDQAPVPIGPDDTAATVMGAVTDTYLELLRRNLPALKRGEAPRRAQDHARATFTCRRLPGDNAIDWSQPAKRIHDLIRGVTHPYPGAFTAFEEKRLTIWSASLPAKPQKYVGVVPGRVVALQPGVGATVLTGDGPLLLKTVQLEGEAEVDAADLLRSLSITLGAKPSG
jgi:methionyl-tRNA formyltransferase